VVAFKDQSEGQITSWKWDFGDGATSDEQNPVHVYKNRPGREGNYTPTLTVMGPAGTSHLAKVGSVHVRGSSPPVAVP
jgi:PKD repeat protein